MEQAVSFLSENLELEAIIDRRDAARGVVVTHPHPLYGGDMNNPVVGIICRAYVRKGFTTLRFNFRGAGRSQGRHDEGRGEQNDVRAAADFLKASGVRHVDLAGYSFGAWVSALAAAGGVQAQRLVMVSPPVAFVDFSAIAALPNLHLVVTGSRDDIAPPAMIERRLPTWNPQVQLKIIDGADHFYGGFGPELEKVLTDRIERSGGPPIVSPEPAG
jgi:alpha/beta superfamily hydrolase